MFDDDAEIGVRFVADASGFISEVEQMQRVADSAEGRVVRAGAEMERALAGVGVPASAITQIEAFGSAYERETQNAARSTLAVEKATERMIARLTRQAETYGMSAAAAQAFRAEQQALLSESRGNTEAAGRLRAVAAEIDRLGPGGVKAAGGVNATRAAMTGLSFQAQDAFTQLSMGANAFSVLAIQGGQAAGQMVHLEGRLGKIANFLVGPWGLALTAGLLVVGALTKGLFENEEAAKKTGDANETLADKLDLTKHSMEEVIEASRAYNREQEQSRITTLAAARASVERAKGALQEAESLRVLLDAELASRQGELRSARSQNFGAAGGAGAGMAQGVYADRIGDVTRLIEENRAAIKDLRATTINAVDEMATIQAKIATDPAFRIEQDFLKRRADAAKQYEGNLEGLTAAYSRLAEEERKARKEAEEADRATGRTGRGGRTEKSDAEREAARALAEQKREYEATVKAAQDYATAQIEAARTTGLNARELRLYADAAAIARAPTEDLAQAIRDAAADREQALGLAAGAQFDANVLQPLRDEAALHGQVGFARERAALELEKQGFMAKQGGVDAKLAGQMWEDYRKLKLAAIGRTEAEFGESERIRRIGDELAFVGEQWDILAAKVDTAARGMADAFGPVGEAIGGVAAIYSGFMADRARQDDEHHRRIVAAAGDELKLARENARFALVNANSRVGLYGDMTAAAKGFFGENTAGYRALHAAEKAYRAFEFAMSVRAMLQDASETISSVTNSAARATASGAEGVAAQAKLPFPFNIAAMAATGAALVAAGIAVLGGGRGGSGAGGVPTNEGKGTVLGDSNAQSQSIKRAIDALKEVDMLMLGSSREMAASLRSIDRQIGGVASQVLRAGDIDASGGINEGFKANIVGSVLGAIPLVGGLLKGLFGSTTTVTGSGLFAGPQSLESILGGGFDASYYSDVQKKSKFLGITTSNKSSTRYTAADGALENQFTLILREFNRALAAAADPLGVTTGEIERRLGGFVVNLGKIDLKGLTGEQVQEKLGAVFGAAADRMAATAFPGIERFQRAGEGLFETAVRVSSTVEQVTASIGMLGTATSALGIDAKLALSDQFNSVGAFATAAQTYFERFYTAQEQAAARAAQFEGVFASLGLTMPTTLAGFRALVDAQNLTTVAGRETYATLLQLAPAFADLQAALNGARSAADILAERSDLERRLLEVQGDQAALRALDLAKLDPANRALQEQIWALQDAQEAARAADDLRKAWTDIGGSIEEEVRRIRGLANGGGTQTFDSAMGQFNAATASARGGDLDAAKSLPGLSQALLKLAADNATSRQELDRVSAQTASSLEETMRLIARLGQAPTPQTAASLIAAIGTTQAAALPGAYDNADALRNELAQLREDFAGFRRESAAGHAATAANTGGIKKHLDNVTAASGGDAIGTVAAA